MKLSELAKKPQLVKLTISKQEIVDKYGDELEFYMYDRQSLDVFSKLANATTDNVGEYMSVLSDIILKEDGSPVMDGEMVLPIDVMTEAMSLIGAKLGK
tara:strand:+ start:208 stop:504 length:297 start_codon:yes stop_codon:yes gene_type:complete